MSSTWYCAAGSATGATSGDGAGPAEEVVIVSNVSDTDSSGTLTIYPQGAAPKPVAISVVAHSRAEVRISDQVKAAWAGVLVEATGGELTVAHELTGPTGRSISDCASTPSAQWYFPSGTTRAGSEMWLALFNPFPGEATVDVAFDTEEGARTPGDFEGIVVPGGSVVVKRVGQAVDDDGSTKSPVSLREHVATTVSVRSGRIVAEQIQSLVGREGGTKGLTATVGATAAAPVWMFPMGAPAGVDAAESVTVFNPGGADIDVLVQVQLDDPATNGTVEPFAVSVPAHRFAFVDVSADERVQKGVPHWIVVRTPDGSDVVAERSLSGGGANGFSYAMGLPVVATRWLAPVADARQVATSLLAVANPSATETATFSVRRQGGGTADDVAAASELTVAPGEWKVIDLQAAGFAATSSVEVTSDIPVVVGQWMTFAAPKDIATPVGVPDGRHAVDPARRRRSRGRR